MCKYNEWGETTIAYKILVENLMARDYLGDVEMVVRLILKLILNSVCWIQPALEKIYG
jgi:hypothetical protein